MDMSLALPPRRRFGKHTTTTRFVGEHLSILGAQFKTQDG